MVDDEQKLVFSACHNTISVWDASNFHETATLKTAYGSVHSLTVSPKYLITGTYNRVSVKRSRLIGPIQFMIGGI